MTSDPRHPVLDDALWARLARWGRLEPMRAGEVLHRQGEPQRDLIAIAEGGATAVREAVADAPERELARFGPREVLGELATLGGSVGYATVRASADGAILRVPAQRVRRLLDAESGLADALIAAFIARRDLLLVDDADAVLVVGLTEDAATLALRRYAEGMRVPHRFVDARTAEGEAALRAVDAASVDLPVVALLGSTLRRATPGELAQMLGLAFSAEPGAAVDLVVIGAGPAGLAAAVYGASEGLATVCVDAHEPGGQAAASSRIENYPGFPVGLSGANLTARAAVQALKFGARISAPCGVRALRGPVGRPASPAGGARMLEVELDDGTTVASRAVVVATGARYRTLPLPGWSAFEGAGIYYAATELEARDCAGDTVVVVGGANSAGQAALFLSSRGGRVVLVVRADELRAGMSTYLVDRLLDDSAVELRTATEVVALHGEGRLSGVTLRGRAGDGVEEELAVGGLFCFIGATPATEWLGGLELDASGFVLTDTALGRAERDASGLDALPFETSVPGVFAVGDVRHGSLKRVAAAVGEGASAIASVHRRLAAQEPATGRVMGVDDALAPDVTRHL